MNASKRRPAKRLEVLDRAALAEAAEVAFTIRPDVVPQPTMWRMRKRKTPAIRQTTFRAIRDVLTAEKSDAARRALERLYQAALGDEGMMISDYYRLWLYGRIQEFFRVRLIYLAPGAEGFTIGELADEDVKGVERARAYGVHRGVALQRLRDLRELQDRLEGTAAAVALENFDVWMAEHGHGDNSENPALHEYLRLRILAPLLEAPLSAYVERHWNEFTDDELRLFVEAGIRREKILLNRAPESRRIQAVLAGELPPQPNKGE